MSTQAKEEPTNNADQPQTEPEKGKSDDKFIGNRKIRTFLLCACLIGFSIFAAGYLFLIVEQTGDLKDSCDGGSAASYCDGIDGLVHAANCIVAGLIFIMLFAIIICVMVCIPTCDINKYAVSRLPALGLILGATLYIFGWVYYISKHKEMNYSHSPDKEDLDATYLSWFGEALLYGATAALLAIDILLPTKFLFEDEGKRLFCNLGLLAGASVLIMPAYFILAGAGRDGAAAIGTGFIFIFISCIVYIVLYVLTCCTCNFKDTCLARVLIALGIVVGGVITCIGYWVFAGEGFGQKGDAAKAVAYYVGYTGLVGGLCAIWALDIAWDDVKNRPTK